VGNGGERWGTEINARYQNQHLAVMLDNNKQNKYRLSTTYHYHYHHHTMPQTRANTTRTHPKVSPPPAATSASRKRATSAADTTLKTKKSRLGDGEESDNVKGTTRGKKKQRKGSKRAKKAR
jgi:hypothetical protein